MLDLAKVTPTDDGYECILRDGSGWLYRVVATAEELRDRGKLVTVVKRATGKRFKPGGGKDNQTWQGWLWFRWNIHLQSAAERNEKC